MRLLLPIALTSAISEVGTNVNDCFELIHFVILHQLSHLTVYNENLLALLSVLLYQSCQVEMFRALIYGRAKTLSLMKKEKYVFLEYNIPSTQCFRIV